MCGGLGYSMEIEMQVVRAWAQSFTPLLCVAGDVVVSCCERGELWDFGCLWTVGFCGESEAVSMQFGMFCGDWL